MISGTEFRLRQAKVERLLHDLRRLVAEEEALEQEAAGTAVLEANHEEAERLRWQIAAAVRSTVPTS
jgi:hypothetical protein